MEEEKIIAMYVNEGYTLRHLSEIFKTNHHKIKRILTKNNISTTRRPTLKEYSEERRKRIGLTSKGRLGFWKGKHVSEMSLRKNMITHMSIKLTLEDIESYTDFKKLCFLTRGASRNRKYLNTKEIYLNYINKFYYDEQFNFLYNQWLVKGKNKWYFPSIDHKQSKANGGNWNLDNIQFLTWFENRAKAEMNSSEWEQFKLLTNTKSDLFI